MSKNNLWGEKTPEEIAAAKLRQRFTHDGFRLAKRETEDHPCPKCGYASLVRATYQDGDRKRVIAACLHCGYEGDPVEVKQERMF